MIAVSRKKSILFVALGSCVIALAIALNIGWVLLNWRTGVLLILGVLFFAVIIAGVVLNTIFLVREIQRNEQHDAFINAVTHELKTPVASLRLYLETLQNREVEESKRRDFYKVMMADSNRLMHTIEQVLQAGRTSRGRRKIHAVRLDLGELARECTAVAASRHHLPDNALVFQESIEPGIRPEVLGDAEELRTAVSNLIDNAIKYSGSRVQVLVEVTSVDAKRLAVRVRDQGVGIPDRELKQIFKRFYRIQGSVAARVKGTGLGLFIVRSIAERHGGRAFAESSGTGHGSTFTLQLPGIPRT